MSVVIPKLKLAVFTAPKCACSSVKSALFELENGFPFKPFVSNGIPKHIHSVAYPSHDFGFYQNRDYGDFTTYAVIRDPIDRFLSCYSNRVGFYGELSRHHIGESDLEPDPPLSVFIEHLSAYRKASRSIHLHSAPMVNFLGTETGFYNEIFTTKDLSVLAERLSKSYQTDLQFPRIQTGGDKLTRAALSKSEEEFLRNFYADDYEVYGKFF